MTAASALAEAGYRVQLVERRGYLGGRASRSLHPGVNEVIDNCQHALIGAYTNLIAFYRRIGVADKIHWTTNYTMIEPGGRRSGLGASRLPAPLHGLPKLLTCGAFSTTDKLSLVRAFSAILLGSGHDSNESLSAWLQRQRQSKGAVERFWRLVIASALNSDIDQIGVNYATMVIRGLFMDSPQAGAMGIEHPAPQRTLCARARIPRQSWRRRAAQRNCRSASLRRTVESMERHHPWRRIAHPLRLRRTRITLLRHSRNYCRCFQP